MGFTAPMICASIPVLWLAISFAVAHLSGWTRLARQFRCDERPTGRAVMCSARIGEVRYKGMLLLRATDEGLHMSVVLPFRFGHEPVRIPWNAFGETTTEEIFRVPFTYTSAGEDGVALVALRLPGWMADCITYRGSRSTLSGSQERALRQ